MNSALDYIMYALRGPCDILLYCYERFCSIFMCVKWSTFCFNKTQHNIPCHFFLLKKN